MQRAFQLTNNFKTCDEFDVNEPVMTGTTIVAIAFENGVILAADSRTSMGTYVANRVTNKLWEITDRIYCCRSGRAAHTQAVAKFAGQYVKRFAVFDDREPLVKDAANFTSKIISENPLVASLIIAGYDDQEKGSVYSVNIGGTVLKRDWAIGGSGSIFLYGYLDTLYRENMTFEEKLALARQMIKIAIRRDNHSGGCARIAIIRKEGVEKIFVPGNEL
ncbi:20S proteasome, regulatory subunit beta type PSMB6/PSMB9/PRE3 [Pseudoloma neurophilia]|uniref:proteasome endopeptidase complex n=1 Tax=Pseudoloma neurophilia TaxID=146866 RepID=A0A0R0M474_9MICR|nr:20S proteasome, regulatory subunit beta type PSMB6/PSMB9/PRE3 [Pseudoloma neurophilia]